MEMTMNVECKQLSYGLILHGTWFSNIILYIDTIVRYTEIYNIYKFQNTLD